MRWGRAAGDHLRSVWFRIQSVGFMVLGKNSSPVACRASALVEPWGFGLHRSWGVQVWRFRVKGDGM